MPSLYAAEKDEDGQELGNAFRLEWRHALIRLGVSWFCLFAVFYRDWLAMFNQWWDSATYNHILLIPAILGWLVWQRWNDLQRLEPKTWSAGLLLFAGAILVWALGAHMGFAIVRQIGAVTVLMSVVPLLLGLKVTEGVFFPLCYMLFLVPFGDELIVPLQMITAHIVTVLVGWSGIPASINGVFIDTPAGLFEVAESCSGVKFLIAMFAFGTLVANVCFVKWSRRILFLICCLIVPIIANGIRAWGTIYVAQFMGAEYAGGFDHIIYGWVFFAVVIMLVMLMAWPFFDRSAASPMIDVNRIRSQLWSTQLNGINMPILLIFALMIVGVSGVKMWVISADRLAAEIPSHIAFPEIKGWHRTSEPPAFWWEPRASGANHRLLGRFADQQGRVVDVFYALYEAQGDGRKAGGYREGALPPSGSGWAWLRPGMPLSEGFGERILAQGEVERLAVTWYKNGSVITSSDSRLRLENMKNRILLRAEPTMMLIISAEEQGDHSAEASIKAFIQSAGPIDSLMQNLAQAR